MIVLDGPSSSEDLGGDGGSQTTAPPLINQSQPLLDLHIQLKPVPEEDNQTKAALEGLKLSDSQSILPESPAEQKEKPAAPPLRSDTRNRQIPVGLASTLIATGSLSVCSGPRCVALFDYEGEEDDELTFSQGDVIALQELVGQEWARGQIHGRVGIFPFNFTKVVEPLPQSGPSAGETPDPTELLGPFKR